MCHSELVLFSCRLNAAEMFVDVSKEGEGTSTNWVAESGVLDLFLLLGPTPRQVSTFVSLSLNQQEMSACTEPYNILSPPQHVGTSFELFYAFFAGL